MPCIPFEHNGVRGIACVKGARRQRCGCGSLATLLCDWKVKAKRTGTCDKPLCEVCSYHPAPEKDLCPEHAAEWKVRP